MLAGPEQAWRDRDVQLVDEPRFEVLADGGHTATDLHILPDRSLLGSRERLADTPRHEVKDRAAFHLGRLAGVMREHEHRAMIRRVLSPPAAPGVIRPRAANRAEHVASHYPGADAYAESRREIVVDTGGAAGFSAHALERASGDVPGVQVF